MRLALAIIACLSLCAAVWMGCIINDLQLENNQLEVESESLQASYNTSLESWQSERKQWAEAVRSRDEIIAWHEENPIYKLVPISKTYKVEVPVEVTKEIPLNYCPESFESTRELEEWVNNWNPWARASGGTIYLNSNCEDYAYAMMVDMVNAGYLCGTQIDPYREHMMIVVPIYPENRYLFIEPQDKTVTDKFGGKTWNIN